MICPKCLRDYRDPPDGKENGFFYAGDDHFYKKQRRYGLMCTNCGFIAEIIAKPTGRPYRKREQDQPDKILTLRFKDIEKADVIEKKWEAPV